MALPVQSYTWPRLRFVIASWVSRTTNLAGAKVLWSDQNQPAPALPYAGLTRRSFPFTGDDESYVREVVTSARLTCATVAAGDSVSILLFGTRYSYTRTVADDQTAVRDALLALVAVDLARVVASTSNQYGVGFQPCTATAVGTSAIDFAGLGVGPVYLAAIEGASLSNVVEAYRSIVKGVRRAIVRVELFWPEQTTAFETADDYANALRDSLLEEDTAAWLQQRGVGVEEPYRITIQDASAVAGGLRETRLFFDVVFNVASRRYRLASSVIDSATAPESIELATLVAG